MAVDRSVFLRSKRKIVLTGSETEEDALAAVQAPIQIPRFPQLKDFHEKRVHMKQKLAAGFRLFAKFGWDEGIHSLRCIPNAAVNGLGHADNEYNHLIPILKVLLDI